MVKLGKYLTAILWMITSFENEAKPAMFETFNFGKCFVQVYKSSSPADEAYLFLHGFPAVRGKNEDLAEAIAETVDKDVYLIHYEGLGQSKGDFSFSRSIEASKDFAEYLLQKNRYQKLHLVGHSWGGLVAVNLKYFLREKIGELIFMAPFTNLPNEEKARAILNYTKAEYPNIADHLDVEKLVLELSQIRENSHPWKIAKKLDMSPNQILILQGLNDDEVEPRDTRYFAELMPAGSTYIESDDDHGFSDRLRLKSTVLGWIEEEGQK